MKRLAAAIDRILAEHAAMAAHASAVRVECARLRDENTALVQRNADLRRENEHLEAQVARHHPHPFGRKSA